MRRPLTLTRLHYFPFNLTGMNATYKLISDGHIRYIGKTEKPVADRLKEHLSEARGKKRYHRLCWLRSLSSPPTIELIEEMETASGAASEIYWIAIALAYGCRLVNGTSGGDGVTDPSPETREKIALGQRGRKQSPECIAKRVAANTGKKRPLEAIARQAAWARGRKKSPEQVEKTAATKRGKPLSFEHRHKLSLAHSGKKQRPEHIEKRAAFHRGRKQNPEHVAKRVATRKKNKSNGNNQYRIRMVV